MAAKDSVIRETLKVLCENPNCECTLQTLHDSLNNAGINIADFDKLTKSFEEYRDIFALSDDDSLPTTSIKIQVEIRLCEEFQSKRGQCSNEDGCNALHICKVYFLSDLCTFHSTGRPCMYGHDLNTPHNKKILRSFCLDQLDISEIRTMLKCPRNRTPSTVPRLCYKFKTKSCERGGNCLFLHLCRDFLSGTCKCGEDCSGHDVFAKETADLLKKYGVRMDKTGEEILRDLKDMGVEPKYTQIRSEPTDIKPEAERRDGQNQERERRRSRSQNRQSRDPSAGGGPRPQMQVFNSRSTNNSMPGPRNVPPPLHPNSGPPQSWQQRHPNAGHRQPNPWNPGLHQAWRPQQGILQPIQGPPPNYPNYPNPLPPPPNQWNAGAQNPQNYYNQGYQEPNRWCPGPQQPWPQQQPNYSAHPQQDQELHQPIQSKGDIPLPEKQQIKKLQNNPGQRDSKAAGQGAKSGTKPSEKDSDEICLFNFQKCFHGDRCRYHHTKLTYQWQYKVTDDKEEKQPWRDFDYETNTDLETDFANPKEDTCKVAFRKGEIVTVNFDDMTGSSKRTKLSVRRLTTPSSESPNVRPASYKWTTEWKWFWQDDAGTWIEYGEKGKIGGCSSKNSEALEKAYLADPKGCVELNTSTNKYKLQFDTMVQHNEVTSLQRRVRRRPTFFTKEQRNSRPVPNLQTSGRSGPTGWSKVFSRNQEELAKHYEEIKLDDTSDEYKKVCDLLYETLPRDKRITSVERIENGELWLGFNTQREKLKRKSGGSGTVEERSLFHGTAADKIEAICRQGFDFRFSGSRVGAIYGSGSYFAKEAKYSDSYAEKSEEAKKMFVARVLVGEFTKGDKSYVRPPPKCSDNPHDLYDSCVDDVRDPKIFVVFTLDQAYPEYIITYN